MRSMSLVLPITALLAGGSPVAAQDAPQAELCLRVEGSAVTESDDPERVTAMIVAGEMTIVEVVPCAPAPDSDSDSDWMGHNYGAWFVSDIKRDAPAGETLAIAGVEAHLGASLTGQPHLLAVRCNEGGVELSVGWHDDIDTEYPTVEVVTGSGASQLEPWSRSTDHESTFYPSHLAQSFVESLYGETSLIVRMTLDGQAPWTAVFDIEGVEQALANVWTACDE